MVRDGLTFIGGGHIPRCVHVVDMRCAFHTLEFMQSGGVCLRYDDVTHECEGSWFWTMSPGARTRFGPGGGHASWHHRYLGFRGPQVSEWIAEGIYCPRQAQLVRDPESYAARYDELLGLCREGAAWSLRRAANALEGILLSLAEERSRPSLDPIVEAALHALGPHFDGNYEGLAAGMGTSLSHLRRRFAQRTGTTMHAHRVGLRIAEAKRLLLDEGESIKAVAERLGYVDVHHFSRQFRAIVGVPPGKFRESMHRA